MAIINIKLMAARTKPTIEIETDLTSRSVLVDTGAHTTIRFNSVDMLLSEFPSSQPTNMVTYIGGLGGHDTIACPVYTIPELKLTDMQKNGELIIHNLPIAVYDSDKDYGYDFLLGGTVFLKVNYAFMNAEAVRHMRIWLDRDIYCYPKLAVDAKTGKPVEHDGFNVLASVGTFFQEE